MTEAGEKWAREKLELFTGDVEHVLRAVFAEVERRAADIDGGSSNGPSPAIAYKLIDIAREEAIGQAFDELKRELLGDGK